MPQSVRLSDDVIDMARATSDINSRSVAGQVEHWVKIGRAVERTRGFDYSRIEAALRAQRSRDTLTGEEQAVYDEEFFDLLDEPTEAELAFFEKMRAEGRGVGVTEDGELDYGENEHSYNPEVLAKSSAHDLTDDEVTWIGAAGAREARQQALDAGLSVMNEVDGKTYLFHPDGSHELVPEDE